MFIIANCMLLFLIKLRWLNNRSIYDKVGKYQTPQKSPDQNWIPHTYKSYAPTYWDMQTLKLIKIKLFAANIFIKGMFQVLN